MFAPRIEDHLELGIVFNAMYPDAVLREELLLASVDHVLHDAYFQRIEISGIQNRELRESFKDRLRICRVKNSFLAQPAIFREQLDLGSADPAVRSKALERMRICLAEAKEVGADMVEVISGPNVQENRGKAIERFAESLILLGRQAQEHNLKLLVEMFDYDVDKKRLIGSVEDTIRLFERIGSTDNVKLLLDLSHIPMVRADIAATVRQLGPWIGHVHVGNTVMRPEDSRYGDSHPYFGYSGGANDAEQLATFFHALLQAGYIQRSQSSSVSFELICNRAERPADLIANAKRTLQTAWRGFIREGGGGDV